MKRLPEMKRAVLGHEDTCKKTLVNEDGICASQAHDENEDFCGKNESGKIREL